MYKNLEKKVIVITGGSGTLGGRIVEEAKKNKARILFTYCSNKKRAQELTAEGAKAFQLDLAQRDNIRTVCEDIKKEVTHIDVLINNAVRVRDRTIVNLEEDDWDSVIEVGLSGTAYLTKKLLPLLYKSKQAKIINIVSPIGLHGAYGQANYAAAKGGLIAFTKSLAKEVGRKKILVNGVNPGFMISEITRDIPHMILDENLKRSCLGCYSDPGEVAQFILYLASDNVRTISGQIFHVDSRIF